ncbi:hypothetical protein Cadr_000023192 [Camelus dromedarius]|uniref:Uncharacterized protein n=1 Tax=Camelus dromedarius TaxID=9838 RepID=A0A5N4CIT2_CAMDR|nr:hypothetical protein Cadr_000023192 [Camelus dromedarius]
MCVQSWHLGPHERFTCQGWKENTMAQETGGCGRADGRGKPPYRQSWILIVRRCLPRG